MRAVLIVDKDVPLAQWQTQALSEAMNQGLSIGLIAVCNDDRKITYQFKHAGYYALAIISRKFMAMNKPTLRNALNFETIPRIYFDSEWEGAWQRIPNHIANEFAGFDVAIKFGMNLLRDPDALPLKFGVLSYHHGDPERYRGRPAGYYEMRDGEYVQGIIVQTLSNVLDGGRILARGFAPVAKHSYARTLDTAYRAGVPLLQIALRNLSLDRDIELKTLGPNFRLPNNLSIIKFVSRMVAKKFSRLSYGLFREKRWLVGRLTAPINASGHNLISQHHIEPVQPPNGYTFAADPMRASDGTAFCELLNGKTGLGEIARWTGSEWKFLQGTHFTAHASYPFLVNHDGVTYMLAEVASASSPTLWQLTDDLTQVVNQIPLQGLTEERLIDTTLYLHHGVWYLFAGHEQTGLYELELWHAPNLFGPFTKHPSSPIAIDPRGARMAGGIVVQGSAIYRFGQDCSQGYGRRIITHQIVELSADAYEEVHAGSITCESSFGPHTISFGPAGVLMEDQLAWIDYYNEVWSVTAGVKRIKAMLSRR